jgi:hypothetical protein
MARTSASARPLTDHDEIRQWAEERGGKPSCVRGTGGSEDVGMIRLDFPGYSGEDSLEEISWDEWFQKFDESKLALLVQEQTARGQQSNFNKLVSRETAQRTGRGGKRNQSSRSEGRTASARGRSQRRRTSTGSRRNARSGDGSEDRQLRGRSQPSRTSSRAKRSSTSRSSRSGRANTNTGARRRSSRSRTNGQTLSSRRSRSRTAASSARKVRSIGKRLASTSRASARKRAA